MSAPSLLGPETLARTRKVHGRAWFLASCFVGLHRQLVNYREWAFIYVRMGDSAEFREEILIASGWSTVIYIRCGLLRAERHDRVSRFSLRDGRPNQYIQ